MFNRKVVVFGLYILVISFLYFQVVFLGKTLIPTIYYPKPLAPSEYEGRVPVNTFNIDLATPAFYEIPINRFVGDMYLKGEFFQLWNPYQGIGTPFAAQYSSRNFFPYQVLENIFPAVFWDYFMLGRLIIAAFFTYLLLRLLGLSSPTAFLGGFLYGLSGSFTWFGTLEQYSNVAMMVPICLYSLERVVQFKKRRFIAEAAIVLAFMLVAGQPEIAIYVMLLALLYYIFRVVAEDPKALSFLKGFLKFSTIALLGLGLCLFLVLPFLEFIPNAYQCHPPGGTMGVQTPTKLYMAIAILVPSFFEMPTHFRIFPHNGNWDFIGGYIGLLAFYLCLLGFFYKSKHRKTFFFFALFGFSIVLKNFGFPLIAWIGRLPLLDQSWSPRWAGPVWTFSLACAAAVGLEMATEDSQGKRMLPWIALFLSLIAIGIFSYMSPYMKQLGQLNAGQLKTILPLTLGGIFVAVSVILASTFLLIYCKNKKGAIYAIILLAILELGFYIPKATAFPWTALRLIPFLLAGPAVFFMAGEKWRRAIISIAIAVLAYTFVDIGSPHGFPKRYDLFKEPEYVKVLKKDKFARIVAGEGIFMPNFSSAFRLFDIRYINSLSSALYQNYVDNHLLRNPHAWITDRLWFTGLGDINRPGRRSIYEEIKDSILYYSFLGTKYILTSRDVSFGLPLVYDKEVRIYKNPYSMPRAYIAHKSKRAPDYQNAQKMMGEKDFDIKNTVILEEDKPSWYKYPVAGAGVRDSIEIEEYRLHMVKLSADLALDGVAVLTDLYYPGWKVFVDGKEEKIFRVNGLVRGVFLKAGKHVIVYKYSPLSFRIGLIVSLACLMLCLFLILSKERRR